MPPAKVEPPRMDVLLVTAVAAEHVAVLAVDTGAAEGSAWQERKASTGLALHVRPFVAEGGGLLWVAVTQGFGMGGVEAVSAAAQLLPEHEKVRCLAMCGTCAGRRGEVALGDVIIADRMWTYDTGKTKVEIGEDGQRVVKEQGDIEMFRLDPPAWKHAAERFTVDPEAPWLALRPRSYEAQGDWLFERVLHGADPVSDPESATIYRRLAEARPDAFLSDLAESLNNLSHQQHALALPEPALTSAREALATYWPFFLAHPAAFARNTAHMINNFLRLLETLGQPPAPELLERRAVVAAHLGG
jgi:nucleoside phosphorylase